MIEAFQKTEELAGHVKEYLNLKLESTELKAAEKSSLLISNVIAGMLVAVIFLLALIFGSIAGAYALSAWIGKPFAGFLIVAGIYVFIGIIVWLSKEKMLRIPIMNNIIHQLFKIEDLHEED